VLFAIFGCGAHFKSELTEMAKDKLGQPAKAYEICSIKRPFLTM